MAQEVGLAIDIGTSVVKVAAYDGDGKQLAKSSCEAPVIRPHPGFSEYDPEVVWSAICQGVGAVTRRVGSNVVRISATGQGDGCWLIDAQGRSVGPSILWNDGRSHEIVAAWEADGRAKDAFEVNGSATFPGAQSAILEWLRRRDPERLDRSATALFSTGWLTYRLSGAVVTDVSDASLPWLDVRERTYSQRFLRNHGLEWTERLRPPLIGVAEPAGLLTQDAANQLGLSAWIPVTHAPFDCVAMALGAGVVDPGDTLIILGTTLIVEGVTQKVDTSGEPRGMTLCAGVPATWLRLFGTLSGTDSLNWATRTLGFGKAHDYLAAAEESTPGAHGLHILPYFSPAGERAPFIDPTARAAVLGLSLDHNRADLARAHLEGLTFALRHCVDQLPGLPDEIVVCGGASASSFWCQLIADVIGSSIRSLGGLELGTLGADVMGRVATQGGSITDVARCSVPPATVYEPQPSLSSRYDAAYARFHDLRRLAKSSWGILAKADQHL